MARGRATSAIARHLWNHHNRTHSSGTQLQREILHEELHATAAPGELSHEHGPNGEFTVVCACGHRHDCTVLADGDE